MKIKQAVKSAKRFVATLGAKVLFVLEVVAGVPQKRKPGRPKGSKTVKKSVVRAAQKTQIASQPSQESPATGATDGGQQ